MPAFVKHDLPGASFSRSEQKTREVGSNYSKRCTRKEAAITDIVFLQIGIDPMCYGGNYQGSCAPLSHLMWGSADVVLGQRGESA